MSVTKLIQQFQISETKNCDKMEASTNKNSGFVSFVKRTWSSASLQSYRPKLNSDSVKNNEDNCPLISEEDQNIQNISADTSFMNKSIN